MREILFRGKRIDNEEWVYGSFCMDALEQFNGLCGVDGFIRLYDKKIGKMKSYEVDRETVGQYTGLTDKNGKKIFGGDIVRDEQSGYEYTIKWFQEYVCYALADKRGNMVFDNDEIEMFLNDLIVVGNIHDKEDK